MKFTVAWSDILSQNALLKMLLLALSAISVLLTVGLLLLSQKEPILIERACYSTMIGKNSLNQTSEEVKAFIIESLEQRFDSEFKAIPSFLSTDEKLKAQKDREENGSKKVRQKIMIHGIEVKEDKIIVDSDRLIAVENIRTAFRFPLEVKVATLSRSERNPYGLILTSVTELQP